MQSKVLVLPIFFWIPMVAQFNYKSYTKEVRERNKPYDWSNIRIHYPEQPIQSDVSSIKKSDKDCKGSVQLAIVIDATGTYKDNFIEEFKKVLSPLVTNLEGKYPGSEFALATFVDWVVDGASKDAYCYHLDHVFTKDANLLLEAANAINFKDGGHDHPEASLTGILYTATRHEMKWSKLQNKNEIPQFKMILVATDEPWKARGDNTTDNNGPPPLGDGYDDCSKGKPDVELVKSKLKEKDIYVTALLAGKNGYVNWKEYISQYNLDPKMWKFRRQTGNSSDELLKQISEVVDDVVCPQCDIPWEYDWDWEWI